MKFLLILCLTWVLAHWWIIPVITSERFRSERNAKSDLLRWEHDRANRYEASYYAHLVNS